jgi:hypothetical protein
VIERRYIDLMNAEIDGANSPDESRELRAYLESSEEARLHYQELLDVSLALTDAGDVCPPPWLKRAIMREVESGRVPSSSEGRRFHRPFLRRVRGAVGPSPRLRPAFAFAGGMAVGIAVFALLSISLPGVIPSDGSRLFGTMGGSRCYMEGPVSFDAGGVKGSANVRYCAENITVGLSLASESEVEVELSYDEGVDFEGLRTFQAGDNSLGVSGHRAELTHSGTRDYELYFTDYTESHRAMRLRVMEGGHPVFESSVPPGRE